MDDNLLREYYNKVVNICMAQLTAKKGIETYGKRAVNTIFKEFAQLHDLRVFGPLDLD